MRIHLYLITIIFLLLINNNKFVYSQSVNNLPNKVLILHSMTEKRPWNLMYNSYLRKAVKSNKKLNVEIFTENLDLLEHNSTEYRFLLEKMLILKYKDDQPDILIVSHPSAVKFIFERNLFTNVPKILILPYKQGFEDYPKSAIISYAADFDTQFSHALKIFPETKEVYVIAGNSNVDKLTIEKFINATGKYRQQISFNYLTNIDRASILSKVKNLPDSSFVYYLSYTQDLSGKAYMAKDFSFELAEFSNRPVFCFLDLLTENTGILGGMVISLESIATTSAEYIEKYFEGTEIERIKSTTSIMSYTYDWNEIIKWGVDIDDLPRESIYYNRKHTFYELYKDKVIIGLILLLLYSVLLIVLLYNNRKKKKSERDLLVKNEEFEAVNQALTKTNDDLKNANYRIEESINRLQIFINTIPDLVWLKSIDGKYLECNNRFEDFFGHKRKDIIGKTDYDFVSKELADFFRLHDKTAIEAGKPTMNEEQITFAVDGHKEFLETIKTPLYNTKGNVIGVLGIGRDISIRKQIEKELIIAKEKAEESDKLKTEFIHNMSHEIRTPMNGILGFSDFLNSEDLNHPKHKHYISIIQNCGRQLMRIIDDILEISTLNTKQVKIIEKEICLNDLLLEQFSIFDIKAKENNTPLYLNKGLSDTKSLIYTDETKLNKIISNLLENALKYTNEGFIEFGYQQISSNIEIYIKDTGIGINKDKQESVFERFSQEEKELSKKSGGLGLGLSIAKENAELLGGKITLKSEKGKGTTFFVTIPYKHVSTEEINNVSNNNKTRIKKHDTYTILIVEDEEVNHLYIETLLENEIEINYTTLHAKNGKEAVDICKENSAIDFILMDMKMPIMNGFEATRLIKEFKPNLPIVAQTAYTTNEDKEKAFLAGCDDYISKPINEVTLSKIMNKYLKIK